MITAHKDKDEETLLAGCINRRDKAFDVLLHGNHHEVCNYEGTPYLT